MRVNLEKELNEGQVTTLELTKTFNAVEEVKLLLEHNGEQEKRVLKNFNLDDSIRRVEQKQGQILEVEDFTAQYGNAYHLQTIKKLALKYRMRFLPLNMFKGAIDPYLAAKLLEFGKKHNIDVAHAGVQDQFYVLAPGEDFRLTTEVNTIVHRKIVSLDPLLFYRGDTKNNKNRDGQLWTLIHKWGTEFNYLRMLRAIPFRNATNLWVCNALAYTAVAFLILTVGICLYTWPLMAVVVLSIALGAIGSCIRQANIQPADEKNMFSENNWHDSRYHVDTHVTEIEYTR